MKKRLIDTNPYLKDPVQREEIFRRHALDSCAFEGARGLDDQRVLNSPKPARKASSKKAAKGA